MIDPLGEAGATGPSNGCAVQFKGIKFAYPQRPDAQVRYIRVCRGWGLVTDGLKSRISFTSKYDRILRSV